MYLILALVLNAFALILTAMLVPGFRIDSYQAALLAAIILGVINTFIKPVLLFLTAPINFLTLGLFTFVINAVVLRLTADVMQGLGGGFYIDKFWPTGIIAAVVLSVISTLLSTALQDLKLVGKKK